MKRSMIHKKNQKSTKMSLNIYIHAPHLNKSKQLKQKHIYLNPLEDFYTLLHNLNDSRHISF